MRKSVHAAAGLVPPVGLILFGWASSIAILLYGIAYSVIAATIERRGHRSPVFSFLHDRAKRPDEPFPWAPLEFFLVLLLLALLLPATLFLPAMAVLGAGDGVASIAGRAWGGAKLPWNPRKSWAGLTAGLVVGVLAAMAYVLIAAPLQVGDAIRAPPWSMFEGANVLLWLGVGVPASFLVLSGFRRALGIPKSTTIPLTGFILLHAGCLAVAAVPVLLGLGKGTLVAPLLLQFQSAPPTDIVRAGLAASFAMVAESVWNRHDNLIVPLAYVGAAFAFGYAW